MAMTKAEKAEMQALRDRLALVSALRWTEAVAPDVPVPAYGEPATSGWAHNPHAMRVDQMWSESQAHGWGAARGRDTASQRGRALYSTRLLALRAMRHAVELDCAARLAQVDKMIEAEVTK
jgi:hypothetical protein